MSFPKSIKGDRSLASIKAYSMENLPRHNAKVEIISIEAILTLTTTRNLMIARIALSVARNVGYVKMAEWSKAVDLSSTVRENAWVRIPLLTGIFLRSQRA